MHPYISGCSAGLQAIASDRDNLIFTMSLIYTTTNILCAATDVGMHGLLASQSCYHSVLPLVCVHCEPVVDFFITKQTSLHPFDFVRNLFHFTYSVRTVSQFPTGLGKVSFFASDFLRISYVKRCIAFSCTCTSVRVDKTASIVVSLNCFVCEPLHN